MGLIIFLYDEDFVYRFCDFSYTHLPDVGENQIFDELLHEL